MNWPTSNHIGKSMKRKICYLLCDGPTESAAFVFAYLLLLEAKCHGLCLQSSEAHYQMIAQKCEVVPAPMVL